MKTNADVINNNGGTDMCRLFGFRSIINSRMHSSLVGVKNALVHQSVEHPDGWGVAYYVLGSPHVIKTVQTAVNDQIFHQVSGVVSSETVIAHLRRATVGEKNILNTHPFQFGNWVFAHNGNIAKFLTQREQLRQCVNPALRPFILGQTDSEMIFYILLSQLEQVNSLAYREWEVSDVMKALQRSLDKICKIAGDLSEVKDNDAADEKANVISLILTNGRTMIAYQGGRGLNFSTYKQACSQKDFCAHYSRECENPTQSGFVNHLVFSSETLQDENIWQPMTFRQGIGVDEKMRLFHFT